MENTQSEIMAVVGERIGMGQGFVRVKNTDHFADYVKVGANLYYVECAWPDGYEAHELSPSITHVQLRSVLC